MGNDTIPTDRNYQADVKVIELSFDCQNATTSCGPPWNISLENPGIQNPCRFQQIKYAPNAMYELDTKFGIDIDLWGCQGENFNSTGAPSYIGPYSSNWDADWPERMPFRGWKSASGGYLPSENAPGTEFTLAANGTLRDELWADMAAFTDAITDSLSCLIQQTVKNKLMRYDPHQAEGTEQLVG
ncbi:hypothetical protein N7463_003228 [Penicillium fimorum]|uniref:Uncharacterized protein n=1 Tax=Penicillium fimorum TaxID=1882269 RepID=A0A9W9Y0L8_9EURO|nr:hypothetical protein N7463_003228 [Penicillium fimorum]